jgi:hypothetical protein
LGFQVSFPAIFEAKKSVSKAKNAALTLNQQDGPSSARCSPAILRKLPSWFSEKYVILF